MIKWIERYSFTDEPDEMGRWARMGVVNGITICWISKVKDKYCTDMHLPTRLSDSPHEVKVLDTFKEAKEFAYNKLREFEVKFNGSTF
jgi:hypothetical protein